MSSHASHCGGWGGARDHGVSATAATAAAQTWQRRSAAAPAAPWRRGRWQRSVWTPWHGGNSSWSDWSCWAAGEARSDWRGHDWSWVRSPKGQSWLGPQQRWLGGSQHRSLSLAKKAEVIEELLQWRVSKVALASVHSTTFDAVFWKMLRVNPSSVPLASLGQTLEETVRELAVAFEKANPDKDARAKILDSIVQNIHRNPEAIIADAAQEGLAAQAPWSGGVKWRVGSTGSQAGPPGNILDHMEKRRRLAESQAEVCRLEFHEVLRRAQQLGQADQSFVGRIVSGLEQAGCGDAGPGSSAVPLSG